MRTLFLDLASHTGLIACVDDGTVLATRAADHRLRDHELLPLVQDLLQEAGWTFGQLTGIACAVGPGGFTSLRVAVACANAWGWAWGVALAGVHLSDVYAARMAKPFPPEKPIIWIHSTKKTEVFVRGYGPAVDRWPTPTHVPLPECLPQIPKNAQWIGELLPEHQTLLQEKGCSEAPLRPLSEVLPSFLASLSYGNRSLEPWYGRQG